MNTRTPLGYTHPRRGLGKPRIRPPSDQFTILKKSVLKQELNTVCQESSCPNQSECWSGGTATFMVLGDTCTRACKFCYVKTRYKGQPVDNEESAKLVRTVKEWELDYVVLTSVDRDDLPDQGAGHIASCVNSLRTAGIKVEVLIPDFRGSGECLETVVSSKPIVIAHNLETVERLQPRVRDPRASYEQSLKVLETVKQLNNRIYTKSSLMLGFGEKDSEVLETMHDLKERGVNIITLGQYLQPSRNQLEVKEFVPKEKWEFFQTMAEEIGFSSVASGPLVRSSYRAGELFLRGSQK